MYLLPKEGPASPNRFREFSNLGRWCTLHPSRTCQKEALCTAAYREIQDVTGACNNLIKPIQRGHLGPQRRICGSMNDMGKCLMLRKA